MKLEGIRQHEEIVANVRGTIEEQAAVLVTTVSYEFIRQKCRVINAY